MWAGQACGATQRESFIFHGTENHWLQTQPPPWADRQCLACASLQSPLYQSLLGVGWRPPLPSNPPALPKLLAPFIWFLKAGVGGAYQDSWLLGPSLPLGLALWASVSTSTKQDDNPLSGGVGAMERLNET